eukprot:891748_1
MANVDQDQYLPDDIDSELNETQKLQLAERSNEIYRQQLKYMQDHLASLLSFIQDQYLPDDIDSELNETQKLQLAEHANEIYRQQLKYMQDHLASLRSLIQDKENIIENLILRYDLGIVPQDSNRQNGANLGPDEIEMEELRWKAEALAQR